MAVGFVAARFFKQIVSRFDGYLFLLGFLFILIMNVQIGFQTAFGRLFHFQQLRKCAVHIIFRQYRQDFDLLYQLQIVCLHGIQAVNLVVRVFMRCRIAQGKERIERCQGVQTAFRFHILRLVDDDDRTRFLNKLNRCFPAFVYLIDNVSVFFKRLDVDHQNLDMVVYRKSAQIR